MFLSLSLSSSIAKILVPAILSILFSVVGGNGILTSELSFPSAAWSLFFSLPFHSAVISQDVLCPVLSPVTLYHY